MRFLRPPKDVAFHPTPKQPSIEPGHEFLRRAGRAFASKETLINSVSLAGDAHERAEEGTSSRAFGAGKRLNQRFPKKIGPDLDSGLSASKLAGLKWNLLATA
ncbi:MAG: hypothetical protein IJT16_05880 [Lachnospiraceae bacterium]|nr:hypothetical protein [Lachnospiraceae bacterium]